MITYPSQTFMISYFHLLLLLPLLITISLSSTVSDDDNFINDDNCIGAICPEALDGFQNYSNFIQNVVYVVDNITSNAPKEDGFKFATYSYNGDPVFGIAQCRGDVRNASCSTCLNNAAVNMSTNCPNRTKGAMVLHDKCFLMYSDRDFFGKPYLGSYINCNNDSRDPGLGDTAESLLGSLIRDGINATSMFAKGFSKTANRSTVQAMVECRRDLRVGDCTKCLTKAAADVLNFCNGKAVGKYNSVNCNVRYEGEGFIIS